MEGSLTDTTIWNGSVFDCSDNEIELIHYRFGGFLGDCNNGSIEARSISVQNGCCTSQLTINVTADMIGKTVSCVHETLEPAVIITVGTLTVATAGEIIS